MTKLWLSLHVITAIVCIGPVTVAASLFPRYARAAATPDEAGVAAVLHRISRVYAAIGISVPVLGFTTGSALGVLGDAWLIAAVVLTGAAAAVLALLILPGQQRLLEDGPVAASGVVADTRRRAAARLAMQTGIFNLLWAVVVVLMIVRPGSTTSA